MSRVRLQFIIGQLTYGGSERHMVDTVLNLDQSRFLPQVVCLKPGGALAEPLRKAGVECLEIPVIRGLEIPGHRLYKAIQHFDPHIVYTFTYVDKLWGRLAARRAGTSVILSSCRNSASPWYEPRLVGSTTAVICNSLHLQDSFRERYKISPERVRYLPNGVDLKLYQALDRSKARAELGLDPEAPLTAQVARFHPVKDHETSLAALKLVRQRAPKARLVLVGHGDQGRVKRLAKKLGLAGAIDILPTTDSVAKIYSAVDLGLLSSRHEGLPRVLIEAAACSRPVLATRVGGVPEAVEDGTNGYLVPPGDPEALAGRWTELLENAELRQSFGLAGRRLVEERFGLDVMMDKLHRILEELAAQEPHPAGG